jgi:aurora kinase, other
MSSALGGKSLSHKNIIDFLGYFEDQKLFFLVMEYAPYGDLLKYMVVVSESDRLREARKILWQITQALHYLENVQVAHRDLKPENILVVCQADDTHVKICDFGWAIWFKPGSRRSTLCGTAEYCPPEMLSNIDHSYSAEFVDRWMLGILSFEIVNLYTPFRSEKTSNNEQIFEAILQFQSLESSHGHRIDSVFMDFMSGFLMIEPTDRTSAENALDHGFFQCEQTCRTEIRTNRRPSVAQLRQIFQHTM